MTIRCQRGVSQPQSLTSSRSASAVQSTRCTASVILLVGAKTAPQVITLRQQRLTVCFFENPVWKAHHVRGTSGNDHVVMRPGMIGSACKEPRAVGAVVADVSVRPLNVPLLSPFFVATTVVDHVHNVAVSVRLTNGFTGWGEIPIMPPITAEDQPFAIQAAHEMAGWLKGLSVEPWQSVLRKVAERMPGYQYAAVRAGFEMALLDAITKSRQQPLWHFFGGASHKVVTDITIPICPPQEAAALAFSYKEQGFETIKTKVGKEPKDDIIRLRAIRFSHPESKLILDANEGYSPEDSLDVLQLLQDAGMTPILFEQPVPRDDWDGLKHVTEQANKRYGVPVAADESCRNNADAQRIADHRLADVLNIKLAKCGVLGALETVAIAKRHGLGLMMGGMVETRLAMGFAAHFAAGVGGFSYIDLDTPLLLARDPVVGGYTASGPHYSLGNAWGHGAELEL